MSTLTSTSGTTAISPVHTQSVVHIIYVHGWRGDHTSFQSFPTDLHSRLSPRIPNLQTHIYPTYKSQRPIEVAVENFLKWLRTISPGLVMLCGHSMGGLLVADAALLNTSRKDTVHPIIGVVAFDVPYLGIHPHVVITGIASLFPKKGNNKAELEKDVNDQNKVNVVNIKDAKRAQSIASDTTSISSSNASSLFSVPSHTTTSLPTTPSQSSLLGPPSVASSPSTSPAPSPPPSAEPPTRTTLENAKHFFTKHADDPLGAMKRWVVNHFEFGSSAFDVSGLKERYKKMDEWDGEWVNFYTLTVPKPKGKPEATERVRSHSTTELVPPAKSITTEPNDVAQPSVTSHNTPASTIAPPHAHDSHHISLSERAYALLSPSQKETHASLQNPSFSLKASYFQTELLKFGIGMGMGGDKFKEGVPRHFIVLPWALGKKWTAVPVAGSLDEVDAHCGIFFRDRNFGYDTLVGKVADDVEGWIRHYEEKAKAVVANIP